MVIGCDAVNDAGPITERGPRPAAQAVFQHVDAVAVYEEGVVRIVRVLEDDDPVALEHARGEANDVVLLEHLRWDVKVRVYGRALAHPHKHDAFDRGRGVGPGLHFPN